MNIEDYFEYDSVTGVITWKIGNRRARAGDIAGSVKVEPTNSYRKIGFNYKILLAHRVAWRLHYGEWPDGQIDHIDGNGLNNKINNLRVVDTVTNGRNRRQSKKNRSGFTGVYWHKKDKRWVSQIKINGKSVYVGCYRTYLAACYSRHYAEIKHGYTLRHGCVT